MIYFPRDDKTSLVVFIFSAIVLIFIFSPPLGGAWGGGSARYGTSDMLVPVIPSLGGYRFPVY